MQNQFIIHQGKKAYLECFAAEKAPPYMSNKGDLKLKFISFAGPEIVVQGIKAALLREQTVTLIYNRQKKTAFLNHSAKVIVKKLPSKKLHVVIIPEIFINNERIVDTKFCLILADNEDEAVEKLYRHIKCTTIPFAKEWTRWLFENLDGRYKEELETNVNIGVEIYLNTAKIEEMIVDNIETLEKMLKKNNIGKEKNNFTINQHF